MKKNTLAKIYLGSLTAWLVLSGVARAQEEGLNSAFQGMLETAGQKTGYKIDNSEMLSPLVSGIIAMILGLLGVIFLVMIFYSGIRWMTAGGREEVITRAKESIKQAIIGLIIVVGAYAISYFFFLFF